MNAAAVPTTRTVLSPTILACLFATWFVWGSTYLGIKFALISFPAFFQGASRFLVAGTLLMLWVWLRGSPLPTAREWRNGLIVGGIMLGCNMGGVVYAEQTVASGLVVAFVAVVPALVTIASLPFGVRPSPLELTGIALGIVGVLMLVQGDGISGSSAGVIALTIAAVGFAAGTVLSQHVLPLAPSFAGFATQMLGGGLVLLVLSLMRGEVFHWPPQSIAAAAWVYLVIFGSLIAFTAYMFLLSKVRPALATSNSFVNPAVGVLLGVSLGGEHVTGAEWIAIGVIVLGVTVLVLGRR